MNAILRTSDFTDAELTTLALAGQRDAFAQIVSRYQSLVCSLAYSATGSLSQSEDLAQETFIAAWKGLRTLREPEKLRSWLCGITRNIIASTVRRRKLEPVQGAESLDSASGIPSPGSLPVDRVISNEEESMLWRSLEHIPAIYREPLVLFYREGKSVESVAAELELSEEAAKQRLSRGRKLLKAEVEAFIESALQRTAPGSEFTSVVLAGLPALTLPASASALGAATSKVSVGIKAGPFASLIAGMLTPLLAALGGFLSLIGTVKSARSKPERAIRMKAAILFLCIFSVQLVGFFLFRETPAAPIVFFSGFIGCVSVMVVASALVKRLRKRIQEEEAHVQAKPDLRHPFGSPESKGYKWNMSSWLLIVTFGHPFAMLTVSAAAAQDFVILGSILAILAVAFVTGRWILIHRPEKALNLVRTVMIAQFPLLLAVLHLRWKAWTGQSPWQLQDGVGWFLGVGFLLFAFGVITGLLKRNR